MTTKPAENPVKKLSVSKRLAALILIFALILTSILVIRRCLRNSSSRFSMKHLLNECKARFPFVGISSFFKMSSVLSIFLSAKQILTFMPGLEVPQAPEK